MKNLIIYTFAMLVIFSACKPKEEKVDTCTNGYIDNGETAIDCGGTCKPCPPIDFPYLFTKINGDDLSFKTDSIIKKNGDDYFLNFKSDSITVSINLGNNFAIGNRAINPTGTFGIYKRTINSNIITYDYLTSNDGMLTFSKVDATKKEVSGYFNVNLSRTDPIDTMKVTSGNFANIKY